MDEQMGRLRKRLKEIGADKNTMIWFCSDNGPEHRTPGTSGGLRARKRSLYEGGIRVPGVMVWPKKVKTARVIKEPAFTSDYLPTVIDSLNLTYHQKRELDGVSLLPLLENKPFKRTKSLNFAFYNQQAAIIGDIKVYQGKPGKQFEMYNIKEDRAETNNIAAENETTRKELEAVQKQWLQSCRNSFIGKEYGTESFDRLKQKWIYDNKSRQNKKAKSRSTRLP